MSFFSRAATTALTGLAALGFASAAFAHHVPVQSWEEDEVHRLMDAARLVGIDAYAGVGPCEEGKGMMGAMYERATCWFVPRLMKRLALASWRIRFGMS